MSAAAPRCNCVVVSFRWRGGTGKLTLPARHSLRWAAARSHWVAAWAWRLWVCRFAFPPCSKTAAFWILVHRWTPTREWAAADGRSERWGRLACTSLRGWQWSWGTSRSSNCRASRIGRKSAFRRARRRQCIFRPTPTSRRSTRLPAGSHTKTPEKSQRVGGESRQACAWAVFGAKQYFLWLGDEQSAALLWLSSDLGAATVPVKKVSYVWSMNTDAFLQEMRAAGKAAKKRAQQNAEWRAFLTGGTLVLTGLLLATIYGLLTQQVPL